MSASVDSEGSCREVMIDINIKILIQNIFSTAESAASFMTAVGRLQASLS